MMRILVLGSGGREHAIAWKLAASSRVERIYVAPGNGGTGNCNKTENVAIDTGDFNALVSFSRENNISLVIPGPEQPLVDGVEEAFRRAGIYCFGPSKLAARIEGSKAFCKDFMKRHNIPSARYATFTEYTLARKHIESVDYPIVIKASGLAAGKGVFLPTSPEECFETLDLLFNKNSLGSAGHEVVIEERMQGPEISVLAFSDGYTVVPLPAAQDHKRVGDGDLGPNTGGMGAYAPAPIATPSIMRDVQSRVLQPAIDGMRKEGYPFVGILFAGIMLTASGVSVLEYNCRFGDPETEAVLTLLSNDCDLADIMMACVERRLDAVDIKLRKGFAATVIAASAGYPNAYAKGKSIQLGTVPKDCVLFHAGTRAASNDLLTNGGRVLAMTGTGVSLKEAIDSAYNGLKCVSFDGMFYRKDIGHRALRPTEPAAINNASTYDSAGVSIERGNDLVREIKSLVKSTHRPGADTNIGGFGGLFDLAAAGYRDPVLVAGTDGVGTKLKIAHSAGKHDSIGIDLVAMCVNDLIVQGAEPLLFLDYYACGHLEVPVARDVVAGIAAGCRIAGCALIGGETAEMPGMYSNGDYDLAGFSVGAVERDQMIPRMSTMKAGDILLGLASSGPHSNGYSLIRKIVSDAGLSFSDAPPYASPFKTLGEDLLVPTRIYVKGLLSLLKSNVIKGMAHITGGGFTENLPRVLPDHLSADVDVAAWNLSPVFAWLKLTGRITSCELARTFNCGIGMALVVDQADAALVKAKLAEQGEVVVEFGILRNTQPDKPRVTLLNTESWE